MGAKCSKLIGGGSSRRARASTAAAASCSPSSIPDALLQTVRLREIAMDYGAQVCDQLQGKDQELEEIAITFDERGGARWRSRIRFDHGGTVSAHIRCPRGDTSGLNCSFYLSSLEGGPRDQDEIDFEFLGSNKRAVQTNFYATGAGHREVLHDLGFDTSADFHEYSIRWSPCRIEWLVDGACIRFAEKWYGESFPSSPMFLYASVWNASDIDEGRWAGSYHGRDAPYVCTYKHVCVPHAR